MRYDYNYYDHESPEQDTVEILNERNDVVRVFRSHYAQRFMDEITEVYDGAMEGTEYAQDLQEKWIEGEEAQQVIRKFLTLTL
jgi:hypothetical protein